MRELDGRSPVDVLNEMFEAADPDEQRLYRSSLFLGLSMDADKHRLGTGDFLVRNLMGADPDTGALHVASDLAGHRVVQFHVRDAAAARSDLEDAARPPRGVRAGAGRGAAVLVPRSRTGPVRGARPRCRRVPDRVGRAPLAGFFGNGEIGPVEGATYLHGYTSAFGIFRPGRD